MKITQSDLIGEIKDFPIEVVQKMIERQVEQWNEADVKVFQKYSANGFYWGDTIEGEDFWSDVIYYKNFNLFFEKYPKNEEEKEEEDYWIDPKGRRMLVWDNDENDVKERIVIAKFPLKAKMGQYMAVNDLDTDEFKRGENYDTVFWEHAKPIPQKTKLSLSSIAEKFGLKPDEIEIDLNK